MPCSEAQRLANQRNARKSTDPKTEAGKMAARLNALTHGLRCEAGLVPAHLNEAVARHEADMIAAYRPEGGHQRWLIAKAADAAAKLDHCQVMVRAAQHDEMDRADLCWDLDQESAVEALAARLPKQPARVVCQLRQTAHGCRWLLARWNVLRQALTDLGGWDDAQRERASQLLGVGPDLRAAHPYLEPGADLDDLNAVVHNQIADLQTLLVEALDPIDAKERDLARLGYSLRPSKEMLKFQRYETKLRRVFNDSLNEFRKARAEGFNGPESITAIEPEPVVEPLPITALEPEPESIIEPEPVQVSEPEAEPFAGKPVMSMLASMVDAVQARREGLSVPVKTTPTPSRTSKPLNRKARRKQASLARKAKAHAC